MIFSSRVVEGNPSRHNPILVALRAAEDNPAGYVKSGDVNKIIDWFPEGSTDDHRDHAVKVILRRISLWDTPPTMME